VKLRPIYLLALVMLSLNTAQAATSAPASEENGGPRNWTGKKGTKVIVMREAAKDTAKVIKRYKTGVVLDNLGCQTVQSKIWCDVQPLGGGPRGYVAYQQLSPAVAPDGAVAMGPDTSALRAAEGKFDATGEIPCAETKGQPMARCQFSVARSGGGYATVVIQQLNAAKTRTIYFRMGKPIAADGSEATGCGAFKAKKEVDLHFIQVGDERYEIPDAAILGG
jgi:hypothetical protein